MNTLGFELVLDHIVVFCKKESLQGMLLQLAGNFHDSDEWFGFDIHSDPFPLIEQHFSDSAVKTAICF